MAQSHFYTSTDGLKLHIREWGETSSALPIVCLAGLTRNHIDFESIAERLRGTRRVVALDYRGRGLSDRDKDATHYDLLVENADILAGLTHLNITQAIVIGTSRGGLHSLLFTLTRPTLMRGLVLNDIGPVIENEGLKRIRNYVGKVPIPKSWDDAVAIARSVMSAHFTSLNDDDWLAYARGTFVETASGQFELSYDPALMKGLEALDLDKPFPTLWPQFMALAAGPLLTIRGENSDLLTEATLTEMAARHPRFSSLTIAGQGHAPLLRDEASLRRIEDFISEIDPLP